MNNSMTESKPVERGPSLFRFSFANTLISWFLLCVLVSIALYAKGGFIRPILGDVLVVVWLYYALASVINKPSKQLIIASLSVAFLVEFGQYCEITKMLGIEQFSALHIILGATFDWLDLIAYSVGGFLCFMLDIMSRKVTAHFTGSKHAF